MSCALSSGKPVILVVEDDTIVRMDTVAMMQNAGFRTIEAENADEAVATLEKRGDIAVIFTDIEMPGSMDGLKLAHAVRGRWPPIKIIVTSGHFDVTSDEMPCGCRFLGKPYRHSEVIDAIRQMTSG